MKHGRYTLKIRKNAQRATKLGTYFDRVTKDEGDSEYDINRYISER